MSGSLRLIERDLGAQLPLELGDEFLDRLEFQAAEGEAAEVAEEERIRVDGIDADRVRLGVVAVKLDRRFAGVLCRKAIDHMTADGDLLKGHGPRALSVRAGLLLGAGAVDFDEDHFVPAFLCGGGTLGRGSV